MIELNKENFEAEVNQAAGLVLVDYWGPKCEHCMALMPDVEELAGKYGDKVKFAKVNSSENRRLCIAQKVMGLPVIQFWKDGAKVAELAKDDATRESIEAKLKELA